MNAMRVVLGTCVMLALCGCVVVERTEVRLTLDPVSRVHLGVVVFRHLESDADSASLQRDDFEELTNRLDSDKPLVEATANGMYITGREARVEKGELVARESFLFADVTRLEFGFSRTEHDSITCRLDRREYESSNGLVHSLGDSVTVTWPPGSNDLQMVTRTPDFKPGRGSGFAAWFAARPAGINPPRGRPRP